MPIQAREKVEQEFIFHTHPDQALSDFEEHRGEFSMEQEIEFEAHLKRIYAARTNG